MNYWFHRISYEARVSYPLLEKGYMTIGFGDLLPKYGTVVAEIKAGTIDEEKYNEIFQEIYNKVSRNRWFLWNFSRFAVGDWVVIPSWGTFAVYEVLETAKSINNLPRDIIDSIKDWNGKGVVFDGAGISDSDGKEYDLGFFVKVKPVTEFVPRETFLKTDLTKRLKSRATNGTMNDLSDDVKDVVANVKNDKPLNFYKTVSENLSNSLKELIQKEITPDKFEQLVEWYMKKLGADDVYIPSKNNSNKPNDADADVIATFSRLNLVVYIQAKHYEGVQDNNWAITQIQNYIDAVDKNNYTCAAWIISSCDEYSPEVKQAALQQSIQNISLPIRLINGGEFAKMLIDVGVSDCVI
ncbi:Restriction endonuclease [Selenomonas ruminantium]|uniref:Restriction endonuclease n=1 Tax=Selenomonas ruminantium TaxID=971 RepID=A0A1I3C4Q7_SELRU|nr:restriction endonuclease [Selenomonas ruminantium]SFH69517.1 Restriction endonuclease [Selenomonas ruminantium]